ncbi:hypothetical protein, partial [Trinickia dabaoshanensis]|uniref:hypothetical protein n=1 Tax=Trinickia dabaoshanensis TaxID=564714 RepID=UPI001E45905B
MLTLALGLRCDQFMEAASACRGKLSLPPKNESLAERLNSSKESQEDEQDNAGALHARIQAGSGSAG